MSSRLPHLKRTAVQTTQIAMAYVSSKPWQRGHQQVFLICPPTAPAPRVGLRPNVFVGLQLRKTGFGGGGGDWWATELSCRSDAGQLNIFNRAGNVNLISSCHANRDVANAYEWCCQRGINVINEDALVRSRVLSRSRSRSRGRNETDIQNTAAFDMPSSPNPAII
ncbi:unnamed protein product [Protopolystoma xenopodis]|uniref:Uncharacterized protein n=1 Tax=Protopolystoma xenopodis TaxID=117903 RepID=A0A448XMX3_9PLAT|nr:unnamed protein product [Protopolystoma xenopodis]